MEWKYDNEVLVRAYARFGDKKMIDVTEFKGETYVHLTASGDRRVTMLHKEFVQLLEYGEEIKLINNIMQEQVSSTQKREDAAAVAANYSIGAGTSKRKFKGKTKSSKKKSVDKTFDLTLSSDEEEEDFTSKKKIGKKQVDLEIIEEKDSD